MGNGVADGRPCGTAGTAANGVLFLPRMVDRELKIAGNLLAM